jgi:phage replication initiation protein
MLRAALDVTVTAVEAPGMLGYEHGIRYFARVENEAIPIARLDWGGNHHKRRGRFDLSGTGCGKVGNWHRIADFIERQFDYTLTRIDLACDLLEGQYTVEDCYDWYQAGEFNAGGRYPRHNMLGDWGKPKHGRTFEVGRRTNGKMLRAYEKGRQLGDAESAWTRFEVEFRNIDRDLTSDMLTNPDPYFAGAYACLERLLDIAAEKVPTHQREGEISLDHLIEHARTAYGKCIHVMRLQMSAQDVLEALTINGVPARLEKAAVGGFLSKSFSRGANHEDEHRRL